MLFGSLRKGGDYFETRRVKVSKRNGCFGIHCVFIALFIYFICTKVSEKMVQYQSVFLRVRYCLCTELFKFPADIKRTFNYSLYRVLLKDLIFNTSPMKFGKSDYCLKFEKIVESFFYN